MIRMKIGIIAWPDDEKIDAAEQDKQEQAGVNHILVAKQDRPASDLFRQLSEGEDASSQSHAANQDGQVSGEIAAESSDSRCL